MISDADDALVALLRAEALRGQPAEVVLDAPTSSWAARRTGPVVDVFLYDLREEVDRRDAQSRTVRDDAGRIVGYAPGPRWYRLSYLVTAWTQRPEDEHTLLGLVLANLVRFDAIPAEHLGGVLEGTHVPLTVGLPPSGDRSAPDLWNALGGELKPALDVVLLAPMPVATTQVAGPPVAGRDVRVGDR